MIGAPVMFDIVFTENEVRDYRDILTANTDKSKRFTRAVRERGVLKSDGKCYVSLAHDAEDIRHTLDAFAAAAEQESAALVG